MTVRKTIEPDALADERELLRQRGDELRRVGQCLTQAREELEDTNRGLIALHNELQAAEHAEARLVAIVQSSDDAIISLTPDCLIQTWNSGAHLLLGYSEAEIVGQPVLDLIPPESQDFFARSVEEISSGGRAPSYDTQWCCAEGTLVDVAVTVSPLLVASGDLIGFSLVAQGITERIEAQRHLERLNNPGKTSNRAHRPSGRPASIRPVMP